MKILPILENMPRSARGKNKELEIKSFSKEPYDSSRPGDYFFEYLFHYDVNGGDFSSEYIEASKRSDWESFQEMYEGVEDEYGIDKADQQLIKNGDDAVWLAHKLGEIESHTDEDEDGRYEYVTGAGQAWILSTKPLESAEVAKYAKLLEDKLDKEAGPAIEDANEARRDADEYARDPYAYYGLKRSDFY